MLSIFTYSQWFWACKYQVVMSSLTVQRQSCASSLSCAVAANGAFQRETLWTTEVLSRSRLMSCLWVCSDSKCLAHYSHVFPFFTHIIYFSAIGCSKIRPKYRSLGCYKWSPTVGHCWIIHLCCVLVEEITYCLMLSSVLHVPLFPSSHSERCYVFSVRAENCLFLICRCDLSQRKRSQFCSTAKCHIMSALTISRFSGLFYNFIILIMHFFCVAPLIQEKLLKVLHI